MIKIPSSFYNTKYLPQGVLEHYDFNSAKVKEKFSYAYHAKELLSYSNNIKRKISQFEEQKRNFDNLQEYIDDHNNRLNPRLKIIKSNAVNSGFRLECLKKDEEDYFSDIDSLNELVEVRPVKYTTGVSKRGRKVKGIVNYKDIVLNTASTTACGAGNETMNFKELLSPEEFYKKIKKIHMSNSINSTMSNSKLNNTLDDEGKRRKMIEIQIEQDNDNNLNKIIEPISENIINKGNKKQKRILFPSLYNPKTTTGKDNKSYTDLSTPMTHLNHIRKITPKQKFKEIQLRSLLYNTHKYKSMKNSM